jgi:peptidoglycan/xylan/chitin deacetylase (PgdA/CDA1 family)
MSVSLTSHLYWAAPVVGGAGVVGGAVWGMLAPRCRWWGEIVASGPGDQPHRVALTFDDGPTAGATERVLDLLQELAVPAAFFVVGSNVRRWPHIVRRMHDEGHLVANHSYDHSHFGFFRGRRYWDWQIAETNRLIEQIIGHRPAMFRPPMGAKTWFIAGAARRADQAVITWSRRAIDGVPTTPERICERLCPTTRAGDIVMLHDGVEPHSKRDPAATVEAVKPLIVALKQRGLTFVRLDELVGLRAYAATATINSDQASTVEATR